MYNLVFGYVAAIEHLLIDVPLVCCISDLLGIRILEAACLALSWHCAGSTACQSSQLGQRHHR